MQILPYVYRCTHKETGHYYIGVRWANTVRAEYDLGVYYFTSSSLVKQNFQMFNAVVLAEFFDKESAFDCEQSMIMENIEDPFLLNKMVTMNGKPLFGGMTGKKHTAETKLLMSLRARKLHDQVQAIKRRMREEHYRQRSVCMKTSNPGFKPGDVPWNKGVKQWIDKEKLASMIQKREQTRQASPFKHSEEFKQHMSKVARNRPKISCVHCHRECTPSQLGRYHGDRCKALHNN